MKKLNLVLPLLFAPILSGCQDTSTPILLTFGTYAAKEAIQLTNSDFTTHYENSENFLLAIYPKDSSCSCWRTFSNVINEAVEKEHLLIYKFYAQEVEDNPIMKDLGGFNNRLDAPTFYIIKEKKIARYYNFNSSTNFFKNVEGFIGEIDNHIKRPKMFYISEEQLASKKNAKDNFSVFYARNKCSDCNFVIPHTLLPYYANNYEKNNLYIFDLQPWYPTSSSEEEKVRYQLFKDQLGLSEIGNATYGFGTGVVPTFHYYETGVLKDACVYANDGALTYSESDNCYYAVNSYYNEARLANLHYLDNVLQKDITKVKINAEEVITYENSHYWDITHASSYYDPLLTGFLDTYL